MTRRTSRRSALARLGAGTLLLGATPATMATLAPTPSQGEGPYYPTQRPHDAGNDLIHGPGGRTAAGVPLLLSGQVLRRDGTPIGGAVVEIWQCDHQGIYRHPRAPRHTEADAGFTGFGRAETDASGRYAFTTIKPVPYTGRPPHIHVKIRHDGKALLTTQLYISRAGPLRMVLKPARVQGRDGLSAAFDFVV